MISEGSDGLSRGLWASSSRNPALSCDHVRSVFQSAPSNNDVIKWLTTVVTVPEKITYMNYLKPFHHKTILNWTTFFNPSPQVARQVINYVLNYWVEAPQTTSALFLLPSVLQHEWGRANKNVILVGTFHPKSLPFSPMCSSSVPLTLLFLPKFKPSLSPRLDSHAGHSSDNWHVHQAKFVRRLPPANLG